MQHCTPEELALAALSEPLAPDETAHLASCDRCAAEVASLRRGVDPLVSLPRPSSAPALVPPPAVWSAIAAATGVSSAPRPEVLVASAAAPPAGVLLVPAREDRPVDLTAARQARSNRGRWLLAVAATLVVGVTAGVAGSALAGRSDDEVTVSAAELAPYDGSDASGEAVLRVREDDSRVLDVRLTAPSPGEDYYEVWLLDPDTLRMIALGVLDGGTAAFTVPAGVDTSVFRTVDVSRESLDGNPEHSAFSIARGEL